MMQADGRQGQRRQQLAVYMILAAGMAMTADPCRAEPPPPPGPPANLVPLLDAMNANRAKVGAGALSWSSTTAPNAQNWANGCVWKHDPNWSVNGARYEIIAANYAPIDASGAAQAVSQWEASTMGHREAMQDRAMTKLGCGAKAGCPATAGLSSNWTYWVCRLN